jgi:hypothetical protein
MSQNDFAQRAQNLSLKHMAMSQGNYHASVRSDGLIIAAPVKRARSFARPMPLLWVTLGLFIALKSLLLSGLGEEAYSQRLALLQAGNEWEKAAGWSLQIEPVTEYITYQLRPKATEFGGKIIARLRQQDETIIAATDTTTLMANDVVATPTGPEISE